MNERDTQVKYEHSENSEVFYIDQYHNTSYLIPFIILLYVIFSYLF